MKVTDGNIIPLGGANFSAPISSMRTATPYFHVHDLSQFMSAESSVAAAHDLVNEEIVHTEDYGEALTRVQHSRSTALSWNNGDHELQQTLVLSSSLI